MIYSVAGGGSDAENPSVDPSCAARVSRLFSVMIVLAVATAGLCVAAVTQGPAVPAVDVVVAAAIFVCAQLAQIRLRVGAGSVALTWGDVGIVAVLCLVPPLWTPAILCAATALSYGIRLGTGTGVSGSRALAATASVVLGAVTATAVMSGFADRRWPCAWTLACP